VDKFKYKIGIKTKVLNLFRLIFTIPFFEKFLVRLCEKNVSSIVWKLVPPEYLYKDGSFRNVAIHGVKYKLDISKVVDHYVYFHFPEDGYDLVMEDIRNAGFILDIGANIGITSLFFTRINPNVKVLAFEPHPANFKRAKEHLEMNNLNRVELLNIGLGDTATTAKMAEVDPHNPGMNRILPDVSGLPSTEIRVEVLDEVLKSKAYAKIDFVKIDVEGYEYAVLEGGREVLSRDRPVIYLEFDDEYLQEQGSSAHKLISLLVSYGYSRFYRAQPFTEVNPNDDFRGCHFDLIARSGE
jgi:FkbM family methyltransferase